MISAVILTKNAQLTIKEVISQLFFCSEILVIDDNSTDKTKNIAEKLGARVITRSLIHDFSSQRNYALQHVNSDWILFIDSDEYVSNALADEVQEAVKSDQYSAYEVQRVDIIFGKRLQHGETGNQFFTRLVKANSGQWVGKVHEVWKSKDMKVGTLVNVLVHKPHQQLTEFIDEINTYSSIAAQEYFSKKVKVSFISIIAYPLGKFLLNYIVKLGFLDGTSGIVMAIMMSFHSFLVRSKLWQLWDTSTHDIT